MELEVKSASNFLVHLIRLGQVRRSGINESQLEKFNLALGEVLKRRYRDHWFPEKPFKGSGYRCLRINGRMDPVIAQAAEKSTLVPNVLHSTFPSELTMWIDPKEVSYRIGENGSICVLYEHKEGNCEPWRPQSQLNNLKTKSPSSNTTNNNKTQTQAVNKMSNSSDDDEASSTTSSSSSSTSSSSSSCKESLRNIDYLLDPRKSVSIEQLAAYVSS